MHTGAAWILILGHHMIDRSANPAVAVEKTLRWSAKTELNECRVMNVQSKSAPPDSAPLKKFLCPNPAVPPLVEIERQEFCHRF